jgi:hypothetical protein
MLSKQFHSSINMAAFGIQVLLGLSGENPDPARLEVPFMEFNGQNS